MRLPTTRIPTTPGEMLVKEFLEPLGMSPHRFAQHMGWPSVRLNEIIHGRKGITVATAFAFSNILDTTPEFWLHVQLQYDLWVGYQKYR